ncbi:MAG: cysteine--tRNA ligase [Candidatus Tectomicrobia bacterium]|uniref:Cysteine--tRNA ligase n=1 Tax=Tectimicrobiota bacterium TaxID=2528274 RepID=A0A933GNA2_UNCTE|nr:cysteine--tRNA ligase [Candidatus Tectomicrobia bacterium]
MIFLFNTLSKKKEPFEPLEPGLIKIYTCGPTVYRDVHIGNLRSYLLADWLKRMFIFSGLRVRHIKNITDVGHMRQEMLERGEDKVIAAALAAGKTSAEITQFYTEAFWRDEAKLGILPADVYPRASQHINECLALIGKIMEKGYAYEAGGNIYFDISKFPAYGQLSGNLFRALLQGVRVEVDKLKRRPEDFTLWKAAEPGRQLKWPSPWGEGFPGWHIECSAMSLKYLGERFDIHTGGVDNIFPHHEDEIAQSEAVTAHRVVQFWVHGQHLLADGQKMAKSTGNSYILSDLENKGFNPLSFRFLCLMTHYRSRLNFTFNALKAAQRGLSNLRSRAFILDSVNGRAERQTIRYAPPDISAEEKKWLSHFSGCICDDLNLPKALAVIWAMLKDRQLVAASKLKLLLNFDQVLGLDMENWLQKARELPGNVSELIGERTHLRKIRCYGASDRIRHEVVSLGYEIQDRGLETAVIPQARAEKADEQVEISSSREVSSLLEQSDRYEFSVSLPVHNNLPQLRRCLNSIMNHKPDLGLEIVLLENGSTDETRRFVACLAESADERVPLRIIYADHFLGEAAGRNVTIKQSLGKYIILLDVCAELEGDIFTPLKKTLEQSGVGVAGAWGLRSTDMRNFFDTGDLEVDAMTIYCFAFPRVLVNQIGLMNEKYRFYRHLDLDYSFRFKDKGLGIRVTPDLPLRIHSNPVWESMDETERNRKSRANYYIFLRKWHHRQDLLIESSQK